MSTRKSNYSIGEIIQNVIFVAYTKMFYKDARLIRMPFVVRGRKYIDFGHKLTVGKNCRIDVMNNHSEKCLKFGKNVNMGFNCRISCADNIEIGNDVLVGSNVLIIDNSHGNYSGDSQDSPDMSPNVRNLTTNRIKICDNVWIGENSVIQQGVEIGYGSIVAANSVVSKSVPPRVIVGGVPARIIKQYINGQWKKVNEI